VIAVLLETLAAMALVVFVAVVTFSLPRAVRNRGKFPGDGGSHSLESVIQALNDSAAA